MNNYFLDIVQMKYNGKNPIRRLIGYLRFTRECNKIRYKSHNIGSLWLFADFIKLAEVLYFYDNSENNYTYNTAKYKYGRNGFITKSIGKEIVIHCNLDSDRDMIEFSVNRLSGTGLNTTVRYINGSWEFNQQYDEKYARIFIDSILESINISIVHMLHTCYYRNTAYITSK